MPSSVLGTRNIAMVKNINRNPGGPVVKNLPCNAEDTGSVPGPRMKTPYAMGQLSPCMAGAELTCFGACATAGKTVLNKRSHVTQLGPETAA